MTAPALLAALVGQWHGTNNLWLAPDQPARISESTATIRLAANGHFAVIEYAWADEGRAQDGLLMVGQESPSAAVTAAWVDSWHMGDKIMHCRGTVGSQGAVSVQGAYAAPPGPDWGWRISIRPETDHRFAFEMFNITPDGQEALAVQVGYARL